MNAWRKPDAPPSVRTMRPPTASFPRLRPRVIVSTTVGITTVTVTRTVTVRIGSATTSRTLWPMSHEATSANSTNTISPRMTSISVPSARRKKPTGCTSSATASPVRISSCSIVDHPAGSSGGFLSGHAYS